VQDDNLPYGQGKEEENKNLVACYLFPNKFLFLSFSLSLFI
jgi:hypothetical protein